MSFTDVHRCSPMFIRHRCSSLSVLMVRQTCSSNIRRATRDATDTADGSIGSPPPPALRSGARGAPRAGRSGEERGAGRRGKPAPPVVPPAKPRGADVEPGGPPRRVFGRRGRCLHARDIPALRCRRGRHRRACVGGRKRRRRETLRAAPGNAGAGRRRARLHVRRARDLV